MRRVASVLFVALALLAPGMACAPKPTAWERLAEPIKAPPFMLTKLDGGAVTLEELRGRIVLMEFWATWCGPCRYSTPSLDAMHRQYRNKGVTVLLINQGEPAAKVRKWVEGRFEAPVLLDGDLMLGRRYNVDSLPTLFILDAEGQIQYVRRGYAGGLEQDLRVVLKTLIDERDAKQADAR